MVTSKLGKLLLAVLFCEVVGIMGGIITAPSIPTWYQHLLKPSFVPPGWLFAPVWTFLYFLMGLSLFRAVLRKAKLKWFYIQLFLNFLWSYLFFGRHEIGLALIEIVVLLTAILVNIYVFAKKDRLAAKLLWPYAAWVSFAAFLNFAIWLRN